MGRLVILSGPSCIGKSPLFKGLKRFHPELASQLKQIVLYNDRDPRPGEEDGVQYHFRPRPEIEKLARQRNFLAADVRGDLQAINVDDIQEIIDQGADAFFEGNPFIPARLREAGIFDKFEMLTVFMSPLSREEIRYLQDPEQRVDLEKFVTDVQRRKLLFRTQRQKQLLSLKDLENIERRAASAFGEMKEAWKYQYIIPLHDGEGNVNWEDFYYPIGEARRALSAFVALLRGKEPEGVEEWEEDLLG